MKLIIVVLLIWIYCVIANLYWYIKSKNLYNRFSSGKEMTSYIPDVDEIFKKAKTSYKSVYDESKNGYRQRSLRDVSYLCDHKNYKYEVEKVFKITIGTFRKRLTHSLFPIHVIFFPSYFCDTHERTVPFLVKTTLNLIYWSVGFLISYHLNALLDYAYLSYFQAIIDKIL